MDAVPNQAWQADRVMGTEEQRAPSIHRQSPDRSCYTLIRDDTLGGRLMEDLARRTQECKESHPLKRWRQRKGYPTPQTVLVLDIQEPRILKSEMGESPTEDEMKTITQRTGITKDDWTAWERAVPPGRGVSSQS